MNFQFQGLEYVRDYVNAINVSHNSLLMQYFTTNDKRNNTKRKQFPKKEGFTYHKGKQSLKLKFAIK